MKKLTITFLLSGFIFFGYSQDTPKNQNIKTLLEMTGSGKLGVQVIQNMLTSFKQNFSNVPEEFWNNFMKEVNPEMLITMIIPIYDKYYTEEDIKKMIEFYQSPVGKKVISTLPQVMQESTQVGQIWGKEIAKKVHDNLKEKGYIKLER